jgi:hypothetical protein
MKTTEMGVSTVRRTQFVAIIDKVAEVVSNNGW